MDIQGLYTRNLNFYPLREIRAAEAAATQSAPPARSSFDIPDVVEISPAAQLAALSGAASIRGTDAGEFREVLRQATVDQVSGTLDAGTLSNRTVEAPQVAITPTASVITPINREVRERRENTEVERSTRNEPEVFTQDIENTEDRVFSRGRIVTYNPFRSMTDDDLFGQIGQRLDVVF